MNKLLIYAVGLVILLSSCDDYLDIKPKGVTLPDNTKSFELLLSHNRINGSESISFNLDDNINRPANWPDPWFYGGTHRLYDFVAEYWDLGDSHRDYKSKWQNIDMCNMVLENIDGAEGPEADRIRLKANTRCHRAYEYFELLKLWCPQYTPANATKEDTGMPILKTVGYTASLKRTTLQETYDFVITELQESFDGLPDMPDVSTRWSKAAAKGMLAKVYLQKGDYELARTHAKECLGYYNDLINYEDTYLTPEQWQTEYYEPLADNPEVILIKGAYCTAYSPWWANGTETLMSQSLVDKFTDTENDVRYTSFVLDLAGFGIKQYAGIMSSKAMNGITTPYMYLIQAEAECRSDKGSYTEAMKLVNELRKHRFIEGSDYTLTAANKTEALSHVMDEKRRELRFCESRFCDIRRLNALHNANISVTHTTISDKKDVTLSPTDSRWTLLIPQIHIDKNPEIVQNPKK